MVEVNVDHAGMQRKRDVGDAVDVWANGMM